MELKCGECGVVFCGGVDGEINAGIEGKEMRGGKERNEDVRGDFAESLTQTENGIDDVRMEMERKNVLEITECDVDAWERRLMALIERWGEEAERRWGWCAMRMKGKPGTLVEGKLVLEEGEERVRVAWMKRLWGDDKWMEHDPFSVRQDVQLHEPESVEVVMGKEEEVMGVEGAELSDESANEGVAGGAISHDIAENGVVEDEVEDESGEREEGGIAARLLRELGMEDYEYKRKETGLHREFVAGERESDDVRDARLLRVFGFESI